MISRIIFLDIDGVFNTFNKSDVITTFPAPGMVSPFILDLNRVRAFNHVMMQIPFIQVVLSSTWRLNHPEYNYTVDNVEQFCDLTGFEPRIFHPNWRTPLIGSGADRSEEVREWCNSNPDVFKVAVLDDNYKDQFISNKSLLYVQTDPNVGLTVRNLAKVLNFFGLRLKTDLSITTAGGPITL